MEKFFIKYLYISSEFILLFKYGKNKKFEYLLAKLI